MVCSTVGGVGTSITFKWIPSPLLRVLVSYFSKNQLHLKIKHVMEIIISTILCIVAIFYVFNLIMELTSIKLNFNYVVTVVSARTEQKKCFSARALEYLQYVGRRYSFMHLGHVSHIPHYTKNLN